MTDTTRTRTTRRDRLQRSREDRVLAGVAGGLGRHLGINPWWFRFAFLILLFFGGFGLLAYIAAWLVIPDEGYRDPVISQWLRRFDVSDGGTIFGLVLVGAAAVIVLVSVADVSGTLVVAAVLFIVGLLLYRGDLTPRKGPEPDRTDTDGGEDMVDVHEDTATQEDMTDDMTTAGIVPATDTGELGAEPPPPAPPAPPAYGGESGEPARSWEPPPPRERSMLGRLTVAIGLIVVASMALIDVAFASVDIAPVAYLATAVAITGAGLLVGSWVGRARWLIIVGVLLLPALWFTSLWPSNFTFSAGEVTERPLTIEELQTDTPYELGFGQFTIDLRGLTDEELAEIGEIDVSLGFGEMRLRLPDEVGIVLNAEVGMGSVQGPFTQSDGIGVDVTRRIGPEPTVLEINAEVGAGVVQVTTARGFEGSNS